MRKFGGRRRRRKEKEKEGEEEGEEGENEGGKEVYIYIFILFNEVIIYVLLCITDESEGLRVTSVTAFPPFR